MTSHDNELDEYGKQVLRPLRPAPTLDPAAAGELKAKFLLEGERLRRITVKGKVVPDQG
jgi:hypothetical protein